MDVKGEILKAVKDLTAAAATVKEAVEIGGNAIETLSMSDVLDKVSCVDERVDDVLSTVAEVNDSCSVVDDRVDDTFERLEDLESRMDTIDSDARGKGSVESRVSRLEAILLQFMTAAEDHS